MKAENPASESDSKDKSLPKRSFVNAPKVAYYERIIDSEKALYVLASEVPEIKEEIQKTDFETLRSLCRRDNFFLGFSCTLAYCLSFGLDQYLRLKNPIIGLTYHVTLPSVFLKFNVIPALVVIPSYLLFIHPRYSQEIARISVQYNLRDGRYKQFYEKHMEKTRNWKFHLIEE